MAKFQFRILTGATEAACKAMYDNLVDSTTHLHDPYTFYLFSKGGVGYLGDTPIMGSVNTKKLNDKKFTQTYGENMEFSYGCARGEYKFYVYRIVLLDDDGDVALEYSTDQILAWCEDNGFEYVPILYRGYLGSYEWEDADAEARKEIEKLASTYNDGPSTLDNRHWREGCVIRRENNARKFDVYKSKNYTYRFLKGMATDNIQNADGISADLLEEMV
jgi:hypothetical protein